MLILQTLFMLFTEYYWIAHIFLYLGFRVLNRSPRLFYRFVGDVLAVFTTFFFILFILFAPDPKLIVISNVLVIFDACKEAKNKGKQLVDEYYHGNMENPLVMMKKCIQKYATRRVF